MPSNKEVCLTYLKKYEEKDLTGISDIFAEDITLRDWKIYVVGRDKAIEETRKNFESVDSIKIDVLCTYENENSVAAELKIIIDGTEELFVVDVMTVDSNQRISSIRAYVGRGNG